MNANEKFHIVITGEPKLGINELLGPGEGPEGSPTSAPGQVHLRQR